MKMEKMMLDLKYVEGIIQKFLNNKVETFIPRVSDYLDKKGKLEYVSVGYDEKNEILDIVGTFNTPSGYTEKARIGMYSLRYNEGTLYGAKNKEYKRLSYLQKAITKRIENDTEFFMTSGLYDMDKFPKYLEEKKMLEEKIKKLEELRVQGCSEVAKTTKYLEKANKTEDIVERMEKILLNDDVCVSDGKKNTILADFFHPTEYALGRVMDEKFKILIKRVTMGEVEREKIETVLTEMERCLEYEYNRYDTLLRVMEYKTEKIVPEYEWFMLENEWNGTMTVVDLEKINEFEKLNLRVELTPEYEEVLIWDVTEQLEGQVALEEIKIEEGVEEMNLLEKIIITADVSDRINTVQVTKGSMYEVKEYDCFYKCFRIDADGKRIKYLGEDLVMNIWKSEYEKLVNEGIIVKKEIEITEGQLVKVVENQVVEIKKEKVEETMEKQQELEKIVEEYNNTSEILDGLTVMQSLNKPINEQLKNNLDKKLVTLQNEINGLGTIFAVKYIAKSIDGVNGLRLFLNQKDAEKFAKKHKDTINIEGIFVNNNGKLVEVLSKKEEEQLKTSMKNINDTVEFLEWQVLGILVNIKDENSVGAVIKNKNEKITMEGLYAGADKGNESFILAERLAKYYQVEVIDVDGMDIFEVEDEKIMEQLSGDTSPEVCLAMADKLGFPSLDEEVSPEPTAEDVAEWQGLEKIKNNPTKNTELELFKRYKLSEYYVQDTKTLCIDTGSMLYKIIDGEPTSNRVNKFLKENKDYEMKLFNEQYVAIPHYVIFKRKEVIKNE